MSDKPVSDTVQLGTLQRIVAVLVDAFDALHVPASVLAYALWVSAAADALAPSVIGWVDFFYGRSSQRLHA